MTPLRLLPPAYFKAETTARTVFDHYITLKGQRCNVSELLECLHAIDGDTVEVRPKPFGDLLVELGVLSSLGSRRWYSSAAQGPNFNVFLKTLEDTYERAERIAKEVALA